LAAAALVAAVAMTRLALARQALSFRPRIGACFTETVADDVANAEIGQRGASRSAASVNLDLLLGNFTTHPARKWRLA
jgi:hypothetical protein